MSRFITFTDLAILIALGVGVSVIYGPTGNAKTPGSARHALEAATIRPTDPGNTQLRISVPGNRVEAEAFTVKDLIAFAYQVDRSQVVAEAQWAGSERYNISGKREAAGKPTLDEIRLMLQTLLADRWQLNVHRETREMPVFVLTAGKGGPKMTKRTEGDGGEPTQMVLQGGAKLPGRNVSMKELAGLLQAMVLDRPVLDKTGLTGNFDFNLAWRPEPGELGGKGGTAGSDPNAPDIFAAVQEQLGLRLESQKELAEVIVVDRVERPPDR